LQISYSLSSKLLAILAFLDSTTFTMFLDIVCVYVCA